MYHTPTVRPNNSRSGDGGEGKEMSDEGKDLTSGKDGKQEDDDDDAERKEDEEEENYEEDLVCEPCGGNDYIKPKTIRVDHTPSRQEVEEHMLSHFPFKAWCKHCVKGKAKGKLHRRIKDTEKYTKAIVSMDYMFMGTKQEKEEEGGTPILVTLDHRFGHAFANPMPSKGVHQHALDVLDENLNSLGHKDIVLKTDQEPDIIALKNAIKGRSTLNIVPEHSPKYESSSNGAVENAIRTVQDQIRTMKDALESRIGVRLEKDENILAWLIVHAAETINRYHISPSRGYTSYEKLKGRRFRREVAEFGEYVLYKVPGKKGKDKLDVRWAEGLYLGIKDQSHV